MEVFISWSGERSKIFAELFHDFVKRLLHPMKPWMSSIEILKGQRWSKEIGNRLDKDMIGVICVTPENQESQWLLFESGAISKVIDDAKVCPVLIGMDKEDLKGPLAQFQATILEKKDFQKLILSLNNMLGEYSQDKDVILDEFENKWNDFEKALNERLSAVKLSDTSRILPNFIDALQKSGLPKPEIGKTVGFTEGFESHAVYETVFKHASKRVYIFGRKNRKVFDKDHWWFFESLKKRLTNEFDFRCLFLDPEAPKFILNAAHQDIDFDCQLNECIDKGVAVLNQYELPTNNLLRKYNIQRSFEIIIIDDAVLFTPIQFDSEGRAEKLTKSSFVITSRHTCQGKSMINNFLNIWESSTNVM